MKSFCAINGEKEKRRFSLRTACGKTILSKEERLAFLCARSVLSLVRGGRRTSGAPYLASARVFSRGKAVPYAGCVFGTDASIVAPRAPAPIKTNAGEIEKMRTPYGAEGALSAEERNPSNFKTITRVACKGGADGICPFPSVCRQERISSAKAPLSCSSASGGTCMEEES